MFHKKRINAQKDKTMHDLREINQKNYLAKQK